MSHDTSPVAGMATGSLPQLCMKMSAIPICGPERRLSGSSNVSDLHSVCETCNTESKNRLGTVPLHKRASCPLASPGFHRRSISSQQGRTASFPMRDGGEIALATRRKVPIMFSWKGLSYYTGPAQCRIPNVSSASRLSWPAQGSPARPSTGRSPKGLSRPR